MIRQSSCHFCYERYQIVESGAFQASCKCQYIVRVLRFPTVCHRENMITPHLSLSMCVCYNIWLWCRNGNTELHSWRLEETNLQSVLKKYLYNTSRDTCICGRVHHKIFSRTSYQINRCDTVFEAFNGPHKSQCNRHFLVLIFITTVILKVCSLCLQDWLFC